MVESSKKIFLVQRSFSEKRLQEKILNIIKDFQNPYPPDIFTWDNQEQITDSRGKYNKMFFTIVENTKDDIAKALVEEELEHHAKEVELDSALEEKMFKDLVEQHGRVNVDYFTFKQTIQKLKEEAFSLPEKELHEKEGE